MLKSKLLIKILIVLLIIPVLSGCKKEDNPITPAEDHLETEGWVLLNSSQVPVMVIFEGVILNEWKLNQLSTNLSVPVSGTSELYTVKFLDHDQDMIDAPDEEDHTFGWSVSDTTVFKVQQNPNSDWSFHLVGESIGTSALELQVLHSGHVDVRTPLITVHVTGNPSPISLTISGNN